MVRDRRQCGLTDARYTQGTSNLFGNSITFGPYADTPRWAGTAYAEMGLPIHSNWGGMSVRGEQYIQSKQLYTNLASTPTAGTSISIYALANFRYEWRGIFGSNIDVAGFLKNAFDREYYTGGISSGTVFGVNGVIPGEPRMYGGEIKYRF